MRGGFPGLAAQFVPARFPCQTTAGRTDSLKTPSSARNSSRGLGRSVSSSRHHSRAKRHTHTDLRSARPDTGPSEQPKERRTARSNHPLTSIAGPLPHRPVFGRLQAIAVTGCERCSRTCAALLASSASSTTSLPMRPDSDATPTHAPQKRRLAGRRNVFRLVGLLHALGPEGQSFWVAETSSRNDV